MIRPLKPIGFDPNTTIKFWACENSYIPSIAENELIYELPQSCFHGMITAYLYPVCDLSLVDKIIIIDSCDTLENLRLINKNKDRRVCANSCYLVFEKKKDFMRFKLSN